MTIKTAQPKQTQKTGIPAGWREAELGEVIETIIDHRGKTPKKLGGDWSDKGYRAISARSIKNGKLVNEEKMNLLSEDLYKKWMKNEIQYGDIILTSEAPLGEHLIWRSDEKIVLSQRVFGIRTNKETLNPFYLNYFIDSKYYQYELKSRQSGTTVTGIRQSELIKTKILLPPLPEQKAIAEVLSSLDDKIDLLYRQNKTLEDTAQALFRKWFVDEADEEWEEKIIGEVLDTKLGGTPSTTKSEYWNGDIPWINSGEINKFRIFEPTKYITQLGLEKSATKLLPKGTTVIAITGATLGQISLLEFDCCANQSVVGVIPNEILPREFVYLWIKKTIAELISNQTGGAQQHINKNDVNNALIVIPAKEKLEKNIPTLKNLFDKISVNISQIRTLENLRDTLLPKLMSGEVRVRF